MAQTSDIGHEDASGWACPYCRGRNPLDAARCAHCGAQLRDPDEDDLFTTVAADNAEVVPPEQPFARDNMWTTDAGDDQDDPADVVDEPVAEGDLWDPVEDAVAGFRPAFSAEPSLRPEDVVDEPYAVDEPGPGGGRPGAALFSSATTAAPEHPADPGAERVMGRSPFGAPGGPGTHPGSGPGPTTNPFAAPSGAPGPEWVRDRPRPEPYYEPRYDAPRPGPPVAEPAGAPPPSQPVPDPHGLSAAVARLRPSDQEAAAAPISVVGALLEADEVVLAAVTGQMLGHPAVVVLTTRRVLVVNGRRWQPIVDVFEVGPDLVVRGRHDRDVAALSFADSTRLSTVDAITEVSLAVELAERIRGEGP